MPERVTVGIEIPLFFCKILVPFHFNHTPIMAVCNNRSDGFNAHARDGAILGVEGQVFALCADCFDRNFVAHLHGVDIADETIGVSVDPNPFGQEIGRLVGGVALVPVSAHQPVVGVVGAVGFFCFGNGFGFFAAHAPGFERNLGEGFVCALELLDGLEVKRGVQATFGKFDLQKGAVGAIQIDERIWAYPKQAHRQVDVGLFHSERLIEGI